MTIELLAHRGQWHTPQDQNSLAALGGAIRHGWGIETDVRDHLGELVISHDPATGDVPLLSSFLEDYRRSGHDETLALNVKSCGLAPRLQQVLAKYDVTNYFVFDMSIPDTISYRDLGMPFYARQSEIERQPAFYDACAGVWLDSFQGDWFDHGLIASHLAEGKNVCVVSPELHSRSYQQVWEIVHGFRANDARVLLCTDHPQLF